MSTSYIASHIRAHQFRNLSPKSSQLVKYVHTAASKARQQLVKHVSSQLCIKQELDPKISQLESASVASKACQQPVVHQELTRNLVLKFHMIWPEQPGWFLRNENTSCSFPPFCSVLCVCMLCVCGVRVLCVCVCVCTFYRRAAH